MGAAMSDANETVVDWLHRQQDWLQKAAELLLEEGALNDADIATLTERLKTAEGQQVTTGRTFAGLTLPPNQAEELRLVSIGPVEGIEKLAPREPLTFGNGNLSVIFGLNGSGKSGYTRILKRACGKPRAAELKPNVYAPPPARRHCTINFKLGTNEHSTVWNAEEDAIVELRAVDFFDADAGTFYLSEESGVSYEPLAVGLLTKLADTCARVRSSLKAEQDRLPSNLPTLPQEHGDTNIGRIYASLPAEVSDAQVEGLTEWKASDQSDLDRLTARLSVGDPAALAVQKRATRTHVLSLGGMISDVSKALSAEGLNKLRAARQAAAGKRKVAEDAAKVAAGTAVLDGVGSATWRAMWEAARKYSATTAYPEQDFPVTGDEARCVLCQQELVPDAAQRLQEFERYVQGTLEKETTAAEAAYIELLAGLPDDLENEETLKARCVAAGLAEGDPWLAKVVEFATAATESVTVLRGHEVSKTASELASPDALLEELARRAKALNTSAEQLEKDATPEGAADRASAVREQKELKARKWISEQAAAIKIEVQRSLRVAELERLRGFANSAPVSNKATRVSEEVVTQAYADRFNEELKALAGPHQRRLKVTVQHVRTERGKALYQLRLTETIDRMQRSVEILSEGEKRVVSLAAFLADVAAKPHAAPFVFDDPISSLDHEFEERVAKRLASLAEQRQVLVFTHRLSFVNELTEAAKRSGVNPIIAGISAYAGTTGHSDDSHVWTGRTNKFNQHLLERARNAMRAGHESGPTAYTELARGVCTDFRRLVERTVEDDLLQQIVVRHRHEVQTKTKLSKLVQIQKADCDFIDELMTKYSKYVHSQSIEDSPQPPQPDELIADVSSLISWRGKFSERLKQAAN